MSATTKPATYYERKARIYRAKAHKLFARGNADKGVRAQFQSSANTVTALDLRFRY